MPALSVHQRDLLVAVELRIFTHDLRTISSLCPDCAPPPHSKCCPNSSSVSFLQLSEVNCGCLKPSPNGFGHQAGKGWLSWGWGGAPDLGLWAGTGGNAWTGRDGFRKGMGLDLGRE